MKFTKLQATGNDFVLIDLISTPWPQADWARLARAMCHRRFGVGSDGLILVLKSDSADFRMRMFNPDGSEAEVCGNGLRCFARHVVSSGLVGKGSEIAIETAAGIKRVQLHDGGRLFRVDMGRPKFRAEEIPVAVAAERTPIVDYKLRTGGRDLLLSFVSMGNPHGVCFVDDVAGFPLQEIGPMRPGSLTRQYRDPQARSGPYGQVSYTRQMKSRTEYVRREWIAQMRRQIAAYKRFKRLADEWVNLGIERSQLLMRLEREPRSR